MGYHFHHAIRSEAGGEREIPDRVLIRRMLGFLIPYKLRVIASLLLMLVGTSTGLVGPYLLKLMVDEYIGNKDFQGLTVIALLYIGLHLINWGSGYLNNYLTSWISQKTVYDIRNRMFRHLQGLSLSFYSGRKTGKLISRVTNDVDALGNALTSGTIDLISNFLTLVGAVMVMLNMNLRLSLTTFTIIPVLLLVNLLFARKAREAYRKTREKIAEVTSNIEESVSGARVSQSFSRKETNVREFDRANVENFEASMGARKVFSSIDPVINIIQAIGMCIILWYGGNAVLRGEITIGVLVAFLGYLGMFFHPLIVLATFYNTMQSALAAAERIINLLETEPEIKEVKNPIEIPSLKGEIVFDKVTFGYDPDNPVFQGLSLKIDSAETVAVVGSTGAGKTTLVNLICRFYDPQEGRVMVDGVDLREASLKSLRGQMGIVLQDTILFTDTIEENIRYGEPEASEDEVIVAAKRIGVDDFVSKLLEGYKTELREGGSNLSVGQRQLIAFARALLADPRILIFDEATSSVDPSTEMALQNALKELIENRTCIIIAHRLSTVQLADRIIVLEKGKVVEEGSHEDLLDERGIYASLYQRQFGEIKELSQQEVVEEEIVRKPRSIEHS